MRPNLQKNRVFILKLIKYLDALARTGFVDDGMGMTQAYEFLTTSSTRQRSAKLDGSMTALPTSISAKPV